MVWIPGIPFWKELLLGCIRIRTPIHRDPNQQITISWYPPWNYHSTWKCMVGILISFWDGLFSGAMLVSGRVLPSYEFGIIVLPFSKWHGSSPLLNNPGFYICLVYIRGNLRPQIIFGATPMEPAALGSPRDYLGGGFKYLLFSPLFREDSQFD